MWTSVRKDSQMLLRGIRESKKKRQFSDFDFFEYTIEPRPFFVVTLILKKKFLHDYIASSVKTKYDSGLLWTVFLFVHRQSTDSGGQLRDFKKLGKGFEWRPYLSRRHCGCVDRQPISALLVWGNLRVDEPTPSCFTALLSMGGNLRCSRLCFIRTDAAPWGTCSSSLQSCCKETNHLAFA